MTVLVWDAWDEKLKDNLYDNVSSGKLEIPREHFMQKSPGKNTGVGCHFLQTRVY